MTGPEPPEELNTILRRLLDDGQQLLALFDPEDRLRHANAAFCQAYRVAPGARPLWADIIRDNHRQRHGAVIEADDIEAWLAAAMTRRGKQPHRAFEVDLWDGRWLWIQETLRPDGWLLLQGSDITSLRQDSRALRQAHVKALRAAETDPLTGLSNRRHALQLLQQALANEAAWPLCVVALDLDDFKRVNDELGHAAGDRVLGDFARQLQASIRREDGCGRLGGEEFLLILPTAGRGQAEAITERLLARVRQARPLPERPGRGYTCSAGLAEACWGESAEALLRRADAALYRAKAAGRDRLMVDGGD
ncbi:diguanylate cyclase [Roseateles sp. DAIF2]|uniref:GGDEF domain-containing protein n=1 Tax=Roseateles sp. DAIF2 TaxID=2714952 RepID=UPI0018A2746F|nr:sensor domain-containing diguanylate cyclase [Roseateles sp. DAIF2]QPF71916.1 diguanylate cyclase [Roseateles sp. DAIF2]